MNTATKVADPDVQAGEVVVTENPRNVAIEAMTLRMEAARDSDLAEAIAEDPGLASHQAQIEAEIEASNEAAIAAGTLQPSADMPDPTPTASIVAEPAAPLAENTDTVAEFIVMKDGAPMFQTIVDGQVHLIPLAEARTQLQIGTAANERLRNAAELEKQATETVRDLSTREAALAQRVAAAPTAVPALTEEDLLPEAKDIFNAAFTGTEEDAAKKLAKTLVRMQSSAPNAQQVVVDEDAIARKAARAAVAAIQNVSKDKDIIEGYAQFKTDYPDIMSNPDLYKMADDKTDGIAKANPDWDIAAVMFEAGKQTRAWVSNLRGDDPKDPPSPDEDTPPNLQHSTQEVRETRKAGLVQIPKAAAGAVHKEPEDLGDVEQTPGEALAELRESRGQPN